MHDEPRVLDDLVEHACGCVEFQVGSHWAHIACSDHGEGSGVVPLGVELPGNSDTMGE